MSIRVTHPNGSVIEFPDGTDEGTMAKVMAGFGAPEPTAQEATPERKAVDQWRRQNPVKAGIRDVARNVVRGLPFGSYLDEAAAGINARRRGTSYDDEKRMIDAMDQSASDNSTTIATLPLIGDVTSGGLTTLASGIATAPVAPVARVMQGATLLPRAVNLGLTGAGYGALYGAGEGNTAEERSYNAGLGAFLGGGIGAIAPVAGSGVSNAVSGIRNRTQALPQELQRYGRPAANRMAELAQLDDLTQSQVNAARARLGDEGMLADIGENMRTATEALNQQPGPARPLISTLMRDRRGGAQARIDQDVTGALGAPANLPATIEATRAHYQQAARPFYDQFRQQQIPVDDELVAILQAVPDDVWPRVQRMMRMERLDPNNVANTGQGIDLIKRALDDAARGAGRGTNEERLYSNLARDLRTHVDNLLSPGNPAQSPWAQGRAVAEEGFGIRDAIEEGGNAFNRNLSADQLAANMQGLSQMEQEGMRIGAREALRSRMANAGTAFRNSGDVKARQLLNSPEAQRKVEMLANSPASARALNRRIGAENTFAETYEQAMNNSATARRQAARDLIPRQYDAKNMGQLRNTSLSGFAMEGIGRLTNLLSAGYLNERNQMIARQMAEMLTAQGVARDDIARGLLEMARRSNVTAQARQQINAFAENLVRGTTRPAIAGATSE